MDRETKVSEWVIYRLTPEEFAAKLGISERIVSVSAGGDVVSIHAKADQ